MWHLGQRKIDHPAPTHTDDLHLAGIWVRGTQLPTAEEVEVQSPSEGPHRRSQATISESATVNLLRLLDELPNRTDFIVEGGRPSRKSRLRLRLFVTIVLVYNVRHETIMNVRRADIRPDGCTLCLRKGDTWGEELHREMNGPVRKAYTDLDSILDPTAPADRFNSTH